MRTINPKPLSAQASVAQVLDAMTAYNGDRLRQACRLVEEKLTKPDVTIGLTLAGAMTPAGYDISCLEPLMRSGFIDWIVTTGANVYHSLHQAMGYEMRQTGVASWDDVKLRQQRMIRIYDIIFPEEALFKADLFFQQVVTQSPEMQKTMGTAEFYNICGRYIIERQQTLGFQFKTLLGTAYECGVPIYTSSPGDSSIGMNVAALEFQGKTRLQINSAIDVNETAALVYRAKKLGGESGVFILGGGSPKNFALQTEPQIQQIFNLAEAGHTYFVQITDARPDTGGLSGATPSEALTWGKVDEEQLPNMIVVYTDSTIALPLITVTALAYPRQLKRLYDKREEALTLLRVALV